MVEGGAEGGFGELYRRHFRPLLGMATALVGSRERREEVVQQAFASAFDRYGHLADPQQAVRRSVLRGCAARKPDPDDPDRPTERILTRVRGLPRAERDVVALHHSLGLDLPEIDPTLGLEGGTAARRARGGGDDPARLAGRGGRPRPRARRPRSRTPPGLGHLLARPGDAQRRRLPPPAGQGGGRARSGLSLLVVGAVLLLRPDDSGEDVSTGGTEPRRPAVRRGRAPAPRRRPRRPRPRWRPRPAAAAGTYTVVSGDGWYAIAAKLDVPVDGLLQANGATLRTPLRRSGAQGPAADPLTSRRAAALVRRSRAAAAPQAGRHRRPAGLGRSGTPRSPLRRQARWWRMTPL